MLEVFICEILQNIFFGVFEDYSSYEPLQENPNVYDNKSALKKQGYVELCDESRWGRTWKKYVFGMKIISIYLIR